jgi:hypothetical protein
MDQRAFFSTKRAGEAPAVNNLAENYALMRLAAPGPGSIECFSSGMLFRNPKCNQPYYVEGIHVHS